MGQASKWIFAGFWVCSVIVCLIQVKLYLNSQDTEPKLKQTKILAKEVTAASYSKDNEEESALRDALESPEAFLALPSSKHLDEEIKVSVNKSRLLSPAPGANRRKSEQIVYRKEQIIETQKVFHSHSSLRRPEIVDPDNPKNRAMINQMISMALRRAASEEGQQ